jgi:hypothetical protein
MQAYIHCSWAVLNAVIREEIDRLTKRWESYTCAEDSEGHSAVEPPVFTHLQSLLQLYLPIRGGVFTSLINFSSHIKRDTILMCLEAWSCVFS